MKVGVVVVTHGQLAAELVNSAEMIVGDLPHFAAVSIGWHDDVDLAREEIGRAIERVARRPVAPRRSRRTCWSSPTCSAARRPTSASRSSSDNVEVITGVNLPMLIKLARPLKATDLLTLAREMREHGRNAIWVASDLLRGEKV